MSILNRITPKEASRLAKKVWSSQAEAENIAAETVAILTEASKEKFGFFTGKSSKGLLGGLFFLLGVRHDAVVTQTELARKLGTTQATVGVLYRKWLEEFPNLFQDITSKFKSDKALSSFVRSRSDKRSEFDRVLLQSIDESIRYFLGETSAKLIYDYLAKRGCGKEEIPEKLEVFAAEFESVVGVGKEKILGAQVLEEVIIKTFCMKLKLDFEVGGVGGFADRVKRVREAYDQRKEE